MLKPLFQFATVLFWIVIPILILTASLRIGFNNPVMYSFGFSRHNIATTTNISTSELKSIANQIREYFNSPSDFLDVNIEVKGENKTLFNDREILHMRDVKHLVSKITTINNSTILYAAAYILLGYLLHRSRFGKKLIREILRGSLGTLALILFTISLLIIFFDTLFVLFHELSFSNDLWQLNPQQDMLIRLFPLQFWFESTVLIALSVVMVSVSLIVACRVYLQRHQ